MMVFKIVSRCGLPRTIPVGPKKAKEGGGLTVNYNGTLTATQRPSYGLYDMMNSMQEIGFQQEVYKDRNSYRASILNIGYAGLIQQLHQKKITQEEFEAQFYEMANRNTDWFDLLFRTPVSNTHNISLSRSTDKLSSRFSIGINNSEGEAKGNDLLTLTASTSNTFRVSNKLIIDFQMNGSYRKTNNFAFGVSPYDYAMNTSRTIPAYNADGTLFYHDKSGALSYSIADKDRYNYNILNEIDNTGTQSLGNTLQSALSLKWNIVDHLQFQGDASLSVTTSKVKSWATEYSYYITSMRGYEYGEVTPNSEEEKSSILPYGGLLNMKNNNTTNYSFRGAFVYTNKFNNLHNITLNAGMQVTSNIVKGEENLRYGYLKYRGETFATVPTELSSVLGRKNSRNLHDMMRAGTSIVNTKANTLSEYITAVYNFDNRYVVNMNGRLDASNRFGQDENKKFNPTFSLGGKWRLGEEHFMEWSRQWFDMLDVSFSYGWRGNAVTAVSPYLIASDGGLHTYFRQYYLTVSSLPYPDLGWEKTKDWNLGIDMSFFDGRFSAGFNLYDKKSKVLSSRSVPAEYGVAAAYIAGTKMYNHGYEFIFSVTPIRTRDWTWALSFNTSRDFNRVENATRVNTPSDYLHGTAIVEGKPYGTFYAFDFAGLSPEDGSPMFNNLEPESTPDSFVDYLVEAGCTEPDIAGGLNTSIRYKNFHLRAAFAMSLGAQAYLPSYAATNGIPRPEQNVPTYMNNRWKQPGDEAYTDIPAIPAGNATTAGYSRTLLYHDGTQYLSDCYAMYNVSTVRVADTDFIRCRSIALQYDLPKSFLKAIGIRSSYVMASLTNPFFIAFDKKWEGRDPETSAWPARRSLSFTLNISF